MGVELEGADDQAYSERQYSRLTELLMVLRWRYPIVDVVGHVDIAPGRKADPGPAFDWGHFRELLARIQ